MVDLEYLIGEIATPEPPVKPDEPTIDDIKNDWDIAVVMQWEADTWADIDLHAVIGDEYVYFRSKDKEGFYLNFDFMQHHYHQYPEILSVKGHKNEILEIYIHNFRGTELREPVNLKVYEKRPYGNNLIKEIDINIGSSRDVIKEAINIDLNTLEIKEINKDINLREFRGGR